MGLLGSLFTAAKGFVGGLVANAPAVTQIVGTIGTLAGGGRTFKALAGLPVDSGDVRGTPVPAVGRLAFAPSGEFGFGSDPASGLARVSPTFSPSGEFQLGRDFQTTGDRPVALLGSQFLPALAAAGRTVLGAVSRQAPAVLAGAAGAQIFAGGGDGGAGGAMFRQTTARVVPLRQLHAINPVTGNLETWLHAGRPTRWSRVNVRRRHHHHHHHPR